MDESGQPTYLLRGGQTPNQPPLTSQVTHPLAPSLGLNLRLQKNTKYARLIKETQLHFVSVAITTFGGFGPQATQFVEDAADFYSAKCAFDNGLCRKQLGEKMQVALLQEVGKRLLVGLQAAAEEGQ